MENTYLGKKKKILVQKNNYFHTLLLKRNNTSHFIRHWMGFLPHILGLKIVIPQILNCMSQNYSK